MQHLDEGTIHSWLDGALSADESARIERHVDECPQCAAGVGEARGFIAGSSRILAALDHIPRRVVPAARPVKWQNRPVWRAAAAVLVVAVGSVVVISKSNKRVAPAATLTASTVSADSLRVAVSGKPAAEADLSPTSSIKRPARKASDSAAQAKAVARDQPSRNEAAVSGRFAPSPSQIAAAVGAAAPAAAPTQVAEGTVSDAASEQLPLKVVGTPSTLGATVTLYEVGPGDTVTLTEVMNMRLQSVVVASRSPSEPQSRQQAAKSAEAGSLAAAAPSVATPMSAPPSHAEVVNGLTTISWTDTTTGNVLKLSGRMPAAKLSEIRLRIERERAAAAAKKTR